MPLCLLVRHGRTTANSSGLLAGWTPGVELDDAGRAAVCALAERLAALPVRRIVTSPLTRCRQTAELLGAVFPGVPVTEHEGLAECRYGAWTGRPLAELTREPLWRVVQQQPSAAVFPDGAEHPGESIAAMSGRAVAAVRQLDADVDREHGPNAMWLAVSHGDIIKAVLADASGAHLDCFQRIVVDPASLSVVRHTRSRPYLLRVNDTGYDVAGLAPPPEPSGPAQGGRRDADDDGDDAVVGGSVGAPPAPASPAP